MAAKNCGMLTGAPSKLHSPANATPAASHDADLVVRYQGGDFSAFEEIFKRHNEKIRRLGMCLIGSREDADEVVQDTFLKCLVHLPEFRGESRFSTWLTRIGINEVLMKLRKRRPVKDLPIHEVINPDGETIPREFADNSPTPEVAYQRAELKVKLVNAVRSLPMALQAVVLLRDLKGLSTAETADVLGLTIGAVKTKLFRARLCLRQDLRKVFRPVDLGYF